VGQRGHFPKYRIKILLGNFNAKLGREDIFKPTVWNISLHQNSNDNDVRIVKFATTENLVFKRTTFPHQNIHKYTWTSPDGKNYNQIDHILVDKRWHSSILDVRSFRGADCDSDYCLMAARVREGFTVSKEATRNFDVERFNLSKPRQLEIMKKKSAEDLK